MKKLPITKEAFEKSNYLQKKYGKLKYVSESGRLFKTEKGKILKFARSSMNESMNWNGVVSKASPTDPYNKTVLTRKCPMCGQPHSIEVDTRELEDGCYSYERGAKIQDAFPNFSPNDREFFMSGICDDCWNEM